MGCQGSRFQLGRAGALAIGACLLLAPTEAVLRYPDGSFEKRFPLHVDECDEFRSNVAARHACLLKLKTHLLEDADCNRVICDQIHTSTPIEVYADARDWVPFKNLCGNMQELFSEVFTLGVDVLNRKRSLEDVRAEVIDKWETFQEATNFWRGTAASEADPTFANSTRSVLLHHYAEAAALFADGGAGLASTDDVLQVAVRAARRLQLLIENVSVTLLLNVHLARLQNEGEAEGRDLLSEMYGDPALVDVKFHELPGKRWDALGFLLDHLGVGDRPILMAEVGVEAANTSQRLMQRNPNLSYLGVDPYRNNDDLYHDVLHRLEPFRAAGRFTLERRTSIEAADLVPEASLDIVFLDARHDFEAVWHDIVAWHRKVKPGGVLSGHDFSWMFPTVAMAVYKAAFSTPDHRIHLTPDGVWWFQL